MACPQKPQHGKRQYGERNIGHAFESGGIPMNIRFTSSIRVQIQFAGGIGLADCDVSWALD